MANLADLVPTYLHVLKLTAHPSQTRPFQKIKSHLPTHQFFRNLPTLAVPSPKKFLPSARGLQASRITERAGSTIHFKDFQPQEKTPPMLVHLAKDVPDIFCKS